MIKGSVKMSNFNNLWNYDFIRQQAQQNYHQHQINNVMETAQKLQDFLDSADKVDAAYHEAMVAACCTVLFNYAKKNNLF